jgi:DNA-binding CsgD family transcriptional regulator
VVRRPVDPRQLELAVKLALVRRSLRRPAADPGAAGGQDAEAESTVAMETLRRIAAEIQRAGLLPAAAPVLGSDRVSSLRPREQQVVRLMLRHYRVPAIAAELGISPQTVRNHLKRAFKHFGVHSQQELLARVA